MTKITLADLTSIQNDPTAVDTINDNSAIIEAAFDNTLSRDGTSPNEMDANIDMNNNRILNLPRPLNPNEPVRVRDVVNMGGSGVGVPPGGSTQQALVKDSNTDYDFDWHNVVNSFEGRTGNVVSQAGDYTKAEVGLGNVDNTSDLNKPISTATQTALNGKQPLDATLTTLSGKSTTGSGNIVLATSPNITTPTGIVKGDVGLGNVDNTSDVNKPISSATQTALNNKQPLNSTLTTLSGKSTTGTGSIVLATNPVFDGYITVNEQANTIGVAITAPAGTPTPNKYIRVNGVGDLDVVDSSFSNQILALTNAGYLNVKDKLSVAKGTDTNSVQFTGAPAYPGAISIWPNANRMILSGGSSGFQFTDNTAGLPLLNISNAGNLNMATPGTTLTMNGATSGSIVLTPPATGGGTVTFFQGSDTVVGRSSIREKLLASRTYYVRTDGNDSNNGLTNNSGGAFLTIQKAIDTVNSIDINRQTCTIQVGAGTYTGSVRVSVPFVGGVPTLLGDVTTPSNVVISTTSSNAVTVENGAELNISGFKITTTTAGDCLATVNAGRLNVTGNMEYGTSAGAHMHSKYAGLITVTANYSVTGNAVWHWWSETAGGSIQVIGRTITITGTPAFSGAWAGCTIVSQIVAVSNTYSGSATGTRYVVQLNGVIYSNAATFPGSGAGSALTGGQYN